MTRKEISALVEEQKRFFAEGNTLDVKTRIFYLKKLKEQIKNHESEIADCLQEDLGKSAQESYMCEIGLTLSELSYQLSHIRRFTKRQRKKTPLANFASVSFQAPSPYGVVLVMSPWNYPFLLSMEPLLEAVAAGNTVVLKPGAYAPATARIMKAILCAVFPQEYVTVVEGGHEENETLLEQKFDYIFFTGSKAVGKIVYEKAAKTLTPVTLELGGKSPCIVDETANIPLAAKRIVWGKFLNLGQTCVAPDTVFCQNSVKEKFLLEVKKQIEKQFGKAPLENPDYGKIINRKHFDRICKLIDPKKTIHGGKTDENALKIEPTVLKDVSFSDPVMQEEIFGPVLPVIGYDEWEEVASYVSSHDSPLALYYFSSDKKSIDRALTTIGFGGGCVNDVVIHLATSEMPFGGFGGSGLGSYHGKQGFDTFTHYKSITDKKTFIDLPLRYQPFRKLWNKAIHFFLK